MGFCTKAKFRSKGAVVAFQQIFHSGQFYQAYECSSCPPGTWHISQKGIDLDLICQIIRGEKNDKYQARFIERVSDTKTKWLILGSISATVAIYSRTKKQIIYTDQVRFDDIDPERSMDIRVIRTEEELDEITSKNRDRGATIAYYASIGGETVTIKRSDIEYPFIGVFVLQWSRLGRDLLDIAVLPKGE